MTATSVGHTDTAAMRQLAAAAALLIVASAVLDISLMFFEPQTIVPGQTSGAEWLVVLTEHRLLSLRNLGVLNMVNLLLEIPLFLALYDLHRRTARGLAALALMLLAIGTAVYIARNAVFSLDALAMRYAAASSETDKAIMVASAQSLLALGEDLTGGMFMGFFITEIAGLVMTVVMLRGRVFARSAVVPGLVGFASLLVFNILAAFAPGLYEAALVLGVLGGLAMIGWYALVARALWRLPQSAGAEP